MVRRSGLMPSKSILSTSPSLNSLRLTQARPSALTSPLPRPPALIAAPMARMVPDEPMASSQVRRCRAFFDAHQLQACSGVGLGVARRGDLAVTEVALGEAHAAHLQAFAQQRFEALADDELGTAAADVGDQALAGGVGQGVRHAEVDQARLFTAGDDLHRVAEDGFGTLDEFVAVARFTQGVGADDAHRACRHAVDQLGKTLEAFQASLHGFFAELALIVDAGGQLNLLAEPLENADLGVVCLGHDHVEAVGAQVDGGDQGQVLRGSMRHSVCSRSVTRQSCHDPWLTPTRTTPGLDARQCAIPML